ncbi:hypothetical protein [uncultured Deinococcus sp.]|uniref:hypothetical protein n=1 Tax=uncultured Deinococcus sp. TaxID=158789 RepID=UPI0025E2DB8D|nr:hypothetical protein [uncultured Deinococcus sp.]
MSLSLPDPSGSVAVLPLPTRGYARAVLLPGHSLDVPPPQPAVAGRLQVEVTLGGNTYAQRYAAKAAGYRYAHGQWHQTVSTAVRDLHRAGRVVGSTRLRQLVAAKTIPFPQWSAGAVTGVADDRPEVVAVITVAGETTASRPIRLLTSVEALLATLRRGTLVVLDTPPGIGRTGHGGTRGGWCAAVTEVDTGLRYQLRTKVLEAAQADGCVQVDPVWRSRAAERWCAMYPMTSRWLEAEHAGGLTMGQRLTGR